MKYRGFYNYLKILALHVISITALLGQVRTGNNTLKGRIFDYETKKPIPSAIIFLQNTTIGKSSDTAGYFEINNIPSGEYEVVFSQAAYEMQSEKIPFNNGATAEKSIYLKLKVFSLGIVDIIAQESDEWKENLEIFKREFIGVTRNAEKCKILNPEVINFYRDSKNSAFTANTDSVIIIENQALGYKMYLYLKKFVIDTKNDYVNYHFYPFYEELPREKYSESNTWEDKRANCYRCSIIHFIRSVINKNLVDDGYLLYGGVNIGSLSNKIRKSIHPDSIKIEPILNSDFYEIKFGRPCVQVTYLAGANDYFSGKLISAIDNPEDSFIVSRYGSIIKPKNLFEYGFWGRLRLADLLPVDYDYGK